METEEREYSSKPISYAGMDYVDYEMSKTGCLHIVLSDKAYASIISEVLRNGKNETGGVLVGRIYRRIWYVVDTVDSGMETTNRTDYFVWDRDYVNHVAQRISAQYEYPLTILGFWHRHPGSMDFFSPTDINTIQSNLTDAANGLLSMLVNIDPDLRMTFYWCYGSRIMKINYDHGNEYFIPEFLKAASPEALIQRNKNPRVHVKPHKALNPEVTSLIFSNGKPSQKVPPGPSKPAAEATHPEKKEPDPPSAVSTAEKSKSYPVMTEKSGPASEDPGVHNVTIEENTNEAEHPESSVTEAEKNSAPEATKDVEPLDEKHDDSTAGDVEPTTHPSKKKKKRRNLFTKLIGMIRNKKRGRDTKEPPKNNQEKGETAT